MGITSPAPSQERKPSIPPKTSSNETSSNILASVHRVMCQVRRTHITRVTRILRRSRIILRNESRVHGSRDLQREPARETSGSPLDRVGALVHRESFLALDAEVQSAVTARATHCLLRSNSAIDANLAGTYTGCRVGEDEALEGY